MSAPCSRSTCSTGVPSRPVGCRPVTETRDATRRASPSSRKSTKSKSQRLQVELPLYCAQCCNIQIISGHYIVQSLSIKFPENQTEIVCLKKQFWLKLYVLNTLEKKINLKVTIVILERINIVVPLKPYVKQRIHSHFEIFF